VTRLLTVSESGLRWMSVVSTALTTDGVQNVDVVESKPPACSDLASPRAGRELFGEIWLGKESCRQLVE